MSSKKTFIPTQTDRIALLYDSVFYEMLYAFGISKYECTDYCAWEHVNFSRMGHARSLYDFFETSAADRRQDDAVSEDFGFPARAITRPTDDRTRLNRQLFHISYARLQYNQKSKPWPDTILSALHDRCVEFIKHLLDQGPPLVDSNDVRGWQELRDLLTSGYQVLIARPFLATAKGVAPGYIIRQGSKLESGRSELTRPQIGSAKSGE